MSSTLQRLATMAYKAIASNPAVRESFASNPGFEPVGMVQTPDGRYTFVGRGEDVGLAGVELALHAADDEVAGLNPVQPFECGDDDAAVAAMA